MIGKYVVLSKIWIRAEFLLKKDQPVCQRKYLLTFPNTAFILKMCISNFEKKKSRARRAEKTCNSEDLALLRP